METLLIVCCGAILLTWGFIGFMLIKRPKWARRLKSTNPPQILVPHSQVEKSVKINVVLTENTHFIFKAYCGREKVNMQDKAKELILEWLAEQPEIGI